MKYVPVTLVHVSLDAGNKTRKVGRLALKDRRIYFEYDTIFLGNGLELSPFKLPLKPGAVACKDSVFEGLFGVFNDNLPDGWGRLLLDRQVRRHGIAAELLTPLDRLSHVGKHGMGALFYEPDASVHDITDDALNLDHLGAETVQVLEGESGEIFGELLALSGSSAGARPKVMVGVHKNRSYIIHGQQVLPTDYEHWMVKFASSMDVKDIGAVEYAYGLMAGSAGIEMMPTHLFSAKKGAGYFGVQRFDRCGELRRHIHTLCGLLHADHRLPMLDYEQLLRATLALTRNVEEVEKMFRLAVFNVFSHNRDDHSKNFAFLMQSDGSWTTAPAYDLTFSKGPSGEHSTTIMGEGKAPGVVHLKKLAAKFSLNETTTKRLIEEVRAAVAGWHQWANEAGVSKQSEKQIQRMLNSL